MIYDSFFLAHCDSQSFCRTRITAAQKAIWLMWDLLQWGRGFNFEILLCMCVWERRGVTENIPEVIIQEFIVAQVALMLADCVASTSCAFAQWLPNWWSKMITCPLQRLMFGIISKCFSIHIDTWLLARFLNMVRKPLTRHFRFKSTQSRSKFSGWIWEKKSVYL